MGQAVKMPLRQLGKSALQISRVGFGCMSLKPGQDNIQIIIDAAIDAGINYFDTADIYDKGLNETTLGKVLKEKRKEIIIATKVGNEWKEDGSGLTWNPTKNHIINAVEKSLVRLQTDYIDLYQLHGGTIEDNIDDTIEAFETLQQQGKIRYYGISSIRPNVIREYVQRSNMVSVMMQYSLLDRRPEESCLPLLYKNNIGVLARGSIAGGLLAGKPAKPYLNYTQEEVALASKIIQAATAIPGNEAATAIEFTLQQPGITAAVVGIRTIRQLNSAIKAVSNEPFTKKDLLSFEDAVAVNYYDKHR